MNVQMRLITADTIDSLTTAGKRSLGEFKTWVTKPVPEIMSIPEDVPQLQDEFQNKQDEFQNKEKVEQLLNQPLTEEEYKVLSEPLEEYEPPLTEALPNSENPNFGTKYNAKPENVDRADESIESLEKVTNKIPNADTSKDSSIFNIDANANGEYTIESRDPSITIYPNAESNSNSEEKSDSNAESASTSNEDKKVIKITKT